MKKPTPVIRCAHARTVSPGDLRPHPRNPNQHPDEQIRKYAKILLHQGWRRPVTISRQSGHIVTGHGAWLTARKHAWPIPIDEQDFATPDDELAHLLADNGLPQLAECDPVEVANLLREIDRAGLDTELAGFDLAALESLLNEAEPETEPAPADKKPGPLQIVIPCKSQTEQRRLLKKLLNQGIQCQPR